MNTRRSFFMDKGCGADMADRKDAPMEPRAYSTNALAMSSVTLTHSTPSS